MERAQRVHKQPHVRPLPESCIPSSQPAVEEAHNGNFTHLGAKECQLNVKDAEVMLSHLTISCVCKVRITSLLT